jgi:hypothetical protein
MYANLSFSAFVFSACSQYHRKEGEDYISKLSEDVRSAVFCQTTLEALNRLVIVSQFNIICADTSKGPIVSLF